MDYSDCRILHDSVRPHVSLLLTRAMEEPTELEAEHGSTYSQRLSPDLLGELEGPANCTRLQRGVLRWGVAERRGVHDNPESRMANHMECKHGEHGQRFYGLTYLLHGRVRDTLLVGHRGRTCSEILRGVLWSNVLLRATRKTEATTCTQ